MVLVGLFGEAWGKAGVSFESSEVPEDFMLRLGAQFKYRRTSKQYPSTSIARLLNTICFR